jgi:hypothetical protein
MKKNAFTLIEILVVVGAIVLIIGSVTGVMFGIFSAISKNEAIGNINNSGNWIVEEIKKNTMNAKSDDFTCSLGVGSSIEILNVKDGEKSIIACIGPEGDYKIASLSAYPLDIGTTTYLFQENKELSLVSCSVGCSILPSSQLSTVNYSFILRSEIFGSSAGITKPFSVDVTIRNE